ncbi:putative signal peptide protein [Puccinia sorghi]|uniref:Putative signal peptide protein n=1 Tax=Puccinia sorghi TaxID=27349 RepID=A0A0L6UFF8_9BASI|nr:putative signal peptide protein [Puccinia sorghi]
MICIRGLKGYVCCVIFRLASWSMTSMVAGAGSRSH